MDFDEFFDSLEKLQEVKLRDLIPSTHILISRGCAEHLLLSIELERGYYETDKGKECVAELKEALK